MSKPMTLAEWQAVKPGTWVEFVEGTRGRFERITEFGTIVFLCQGCHLPYSAHPWELRIVEPTTAERFAALPEELHLPALGGAHWPPNYDIEPLAWVRDKRYHVRHRAGSGHWHELAVVNDSLTAAELIARHRAGLEAEAKTDD